MLAKKPLSILSVIVLVSGICGIAVAATPTEIEEAIEGDIAWLAAPQNLPAGYTITSGTISAGSDYSCPLWVEVIDRDGVDGGHLTVELDSCQIYEYTLYYRSQGGGTGYIADLEPCDVFIEWDEDDGHGSLHYFDFNGVYVEETPSYIQVTGTGSTNWTVYTVISSGTLIKTNDVYNEHEAIHLKRCPVLLEKVDDVNDGDCCQPSDEITYTVDYNYPCLLSCPDINDVNIIDYLPPEVDFVSSEPEPSEIIDCNKIIWKIGNLHPGDKGSVTLKVRVKCVEPGSTIRNYCEIKTGDQVRNSTYEYTSICVDYLVVEDFEGYTDGNSIREVWHDTGGSIINTSTDVNGPIHRGVQAMVIDYSNTASPYYSEAYADTSGTDSLGFGTNWRLEDARVLSLWLRGIEDLRGSHTGSDPYTLEGDGAGIDGTKYDNCYFFYKEIDSLTAIVEARVDSIENTNPSAMAGVMMRDTLDANSVYYATVVTPDDKVIFMRRTDTGDISTAYASVDGSTPHWVRISRYYLVAPPELVFAQHANDVGGSPGKWSPVGDLSPLDIGEQPTYIGLCVTSNSFGDMCTAEFSEVYMEKDITLVGPGCNDIIEPDSGADIGGYAYNDPQPMYVVLQDSDSDGIMYHNGKDANATQTADWTEWLIDLSDFIEQGVDACDIQRMYIGIGDKDVPSSGSGTVFIDDIRLYPYRCLDRPASDLTCDCVVDFRDFAVTTSEWFEMGCPVADLYEDGEVDFKDLAILAERWLEDRRWP